MCAFPSWASRECFFKLATKLENTLNTQKPSIISYEQQKAGIVKQNLTPEDYQRKMKALAKKLGV